MASLRAFVAAFPDIAARRHLYGAIEALRETHEDRRYRWLRAETYHLTLRFLGSIDEGCVPALRDELTAVVERHRVVRSHTQGVIALPSARRPNVIALEVGSDGALEALAADVAQAVEPEHGSPDKPFRSHLTVIRCRPGARYHRVPIPAIELAFESVGLYRSETERDGARYTPVFELPLRSG